MASKITVGKIVATSSDSGWSQAYHAGGFTAVVCVTPQKDEEKAALQVAGKQVLDTLVSEYFTLTTKDLQTVTQAVQATVDKIPSNITASLIVAACIKNVLYVVIAHEGRVLLKRREKIGALLEVTPDSSEKIASVSGFLEPGDLVLLHTKGFEKIFSHEDIVAAFEEKGPEELAEYFAPKVHESQNGSASALVFSYQEDETTPPIEPVEKKTFETHFAEEKAPEENRDAEKPLAPLPGFGEPLPQKKQRSSGSFSHRQRLFLTITIVLTLVLIGSVGFFIYRQQQAKLTAQFSAVYSPAKTKYDEAQGLLSLNKALAIQDLQEAQSSLQNAQKDFPANSSQEKQLNSLLQQVTDSLTAAQKVPLLSASKASDTASPLLSFVSSHTAPYVSSDDTNFYTADNTAITSYSQKGGTGKKIISADWKTIGGFQTYLGNMYVVDQKAGVLKYVASGASFGNASQYFASGVSPDLSKTVSMAIDGSVWLLGSDGSITKYTKGTQDSFAVNGLDTPLSNPTEIFTTIDLTNVYILDKGNERVVVVKKDGTFVAQYASDTIRSTSLIDVSEKDKKIYLLSQNTIYQLDLQ